MDAFLDFLLVFLLTIVAGVFSASELALVTLRDSQLDTLAGKSKRGAKVAKVARDRNRFLSAAQIGVTFVGFFSASYGAATLAPYVEPLLVGAGLPIPVAKTVALVALTILITYLSLVFGELVPKRLAMQKPESISMVVAGALDKFATLMKPVIWLLSRSTDIVFRLVGGSSSASQSAISEEELQNIVETHEAFDDGERQILSDVIDAGNSSLTEVMRPRGDVDFIDGSLSLSEAANYVRDRPYSRFPVIGDDFDDVIGFIHVRDVLDIGGSGSAETVRDVTRTILKFPGTNRLFPSLATMRDRGIHIAIVLDEYGGTDGICTLEDIIEEMIGDIHDEYDVRENPEVRSGKDASYSVDGGMNLEDFADETGISLAEGPYETVAGYILAELGAIPSVGDCVIVKSLGGFVDGSSSSDDEAFDASNSKYTLTVSKMEDKRIARVKVRVMSNLGGDIA